MVVKLRLLCSSKKSREFPAFFIYRNMCHFLTYVGLLHSVRCSCITFPNMIIIRKAL